MMSNPVYLIQDGIIAGAAELTKQHCGNCGSNVLTLKVSDIRLPEGIKPGKTLIAYRSNDPKLRPHLFLGIGCGCYAKFHRQIAHIQSSKK